MKRVFNSRHVNKRVQRATLHPKLLVIALPIVKGIGNVREVIQDVICIQLRSKKGLKMICQLRREVNTIPLCKTCVIIRNAELQRYHFA